jgi:hypothetical protein
MKIAPVTVPNRTKLGTELPTECGGLRWRRFDINPDAPATPKHCREVWLSHTYMVQLFIEPSGWMRLGICNRTQTEIATSWSQIQSIKNDIIGEDQDAIEIYPAEQDLVNHAPMRWLCIPPAGRLDLPCVWRKGTPSI